jgi:hemolysin activation/secretion protein
MKRNSWLTLTALAVSTLPVLAQQARPDSGTILETQRPQQPTAPAPGGGPAIVLPPPPAAAPIDRSIRVTPTAFSIQGNTLFPDAALQAAVAPYVGKPTDMEGLLQAAGAVRRYYRDRGYLLTEAYLPQQQFPAAGGTVIIRVLEARVGRVNVKVEGGGISESLASKIVHTHLHTGDYISENSLDKPVLLLRDLSGFDAAASVEPGTSVGEADITVTVKPYGPKFDGLVGLDNYGVYPSGEFRVYADGNWNNPTGHGDQLSLRLQASNHSHSDLYRLGYSIPVTGYATRLGLSATRSEYALGKQFEALGASGDAKVYDISLTHPFIRSRTRNVLGAITLERKDLTDITTSPPSDQNKQVDGVRFSVLGNWVDSAFRESFNSFTVSVFQGHLKLDPTTQALDQGTTGFNTAGSFTKLNLDFLRSTYITPKDRISVGLQAQFASKNLTSAEKMPLGGPTGVRGYAVGEAVGDSGEIVNLEYQRVLPNFGMSVPFTGSIFYDWGHVRYNENGAPAALVASATPPAVSDTLQSLGFGLTVGTYGKFLLSTQLAWRLSDYKPTIAPDRRPTIWFSLQKWL